MEVRRVLFRSGLSSNFSKYCVFNVRLLLSRLIKTSDLFEAGETPFAAASTKGGKRASDKENSRSSSTGFCGSSPQEKDGWKTKAANADSAKRTRFIQIPASVKLPWKRACRRTASVMSCKSRIT